MDAVLDRLHAEALARIAADKNTCPLQVTIAFNGHEIYTGLGSADTFLMVGAEPYDEWYTSVGDENAKGPKSMFFGDGQDSYWDPKHLIPEPIAREAVRFYVEHQQRSPSLKWEY